MPIFTFNPFAKVRKYIAVMLRKSEKFLKTIFNNWDKNFTLIITFKMMSPGQLYFLIQPNSLLQLQHF